VQTPSARRAASGSADADGALVGPEEAGAHPEGGGLPGAVGAEESQHLAGAAREIDAVHDALSAQRLHEATGVEEEVGVAHRGAGIIPGNPGSGKMGVPVARGRSGCACSF
jgi:hypothetical protein